MRSFGALLIAAFVEISLVLSPAGRLWSNPLFETQASPASPG
jgi:hypothetical protein